MTKLDDSPVETLDELPVLNLDGAEWLPTMTRGQECDAYADEVRPMTLPDLLALVAALPDEQKMQVILLVRESWSRMIDVYSDNLHAAQQELSSTRRELEQAKREERERIANIFANGNPPMLAVADAIRALPDEEP